MTGVSLSRWTMSYFAAALTALLAAEALMAMGYGFPNAALGAPATLILVHVIAIGWLSLLLCGALFQFVPVLTARPLYSNILPLPALLFLLAGLLALVAGFLQLARGIATGRSLLPFAGGLLGSGFLLVIWNLARTLCPAQPLPVPARFLVTGLACLGATFLLGIFFVLVLGGSTALPPLAAMAGAALPIHVIAGFGGWLTFTAMGVSYRLLAMFMLAPEQAGPRSRAVFRLGTAALGIAVLGGPAAILVGSGLQAVLALAAVAGLAAVVLYGADAVYLYRARKRRVIELNSRMAAFALASLAAAVVLAAASLALGWLPDDAGAVVFLVAFGWLSGLGLAMLYKIVPFLTWLECYGPVLGRAQAPRVQDLVVEPRAAPWFLLYFCAVWAGTAALIADHPVLFRGAAAAMLLATAAIVVQVVRARRLADVNDTVRFPEGTRRPRLLYSLSQPTST